MTNLSFDPAAFLLEQLNVINPDMLLALSESNVTISNPLPTDEAVATDSVAPAINTTATLTGVTGQGYTSTAQFYYQRLNPAAYLAASGYTGTLTLPVEGITDWASFFTAFNAAYGTVFTEVDYPTVPYSRPVNGPLIVTMPPGSLLFVGSMSVTMDTITLDLATVLTQTVLSGLNPPPTPL